MISVCAKRVFVKDMNVNPPIVEIDYNIISSSFNQSKGIRTSRPVTRSNDLKKNNTALSMLVVKIEKTCI